MGAEKLLKDIQKQYDNWDEISMFEMSGVRGLSVADLDVLELYAEEYLSKGTIDHLMRPRGGVEKILINYGIQYNGR